MSEPGPGARQLAEMFHDRYERLAPSFGYETRKETRAFDPTTPNGRLMIAVCDEILTWFDLRVTADELARVRHEFKNFHRLLCERFGYGHDESDWQRDQLSLIEWIAKLHPGEGDNRAVSTEGCCRAATVSGTPESYSCSDPRQDARTSAGDRAPSPVLPADETAAAPFDPIVRCKCGWQGLVSKVHAARNGCPACGEPFVSADALLAIRREAE